MAYLLAALLLAASFAGGFDPGGLLIVQRVLGHPDVLRVIAFGLAVIATACGLRGASRRRKAALVALIVVGALAGLYFAAAGFLAGFDSGLRVTNSLAAPQGKSYRAVMLQSDDESDGLETVVIRTGHGVLTRQWVAACEGRYELRSASWVGSDRLTITLQDADARRDGETFVVQVDPDTGKPQLQADKDLNCQ